MRGAWGGHCGSLSHIIVPGNEISPCFYVYLLADVLVLGMGTKVKKVDPAILSYLHRKGISVEIQDTVRRDWSLVRCTARYVTLIVYVFLSLPSQPNACATFNFLLDEGRPAGAALIPPDYVPP